MDEQTARWLAGPEAAEALQEAAAQADPTSLAAAAALRRSYPPERAAAVLSQEALRRRAVAKFGDAARGMLFTPNGLEQATRPTVARWRAERFAAAGGSAILDVGCGIGTDAMAFAEAGLEVVGIEIDPATAVLAQANLGERGRVVVGDAEEVVPGLLTPGMAVFADPARRTARGRTWQVADFRPRWEFITALLGGERPACVKAGPGLPWRLIPDGVAAVWVSDHGDLVEASLWAGASAWVPGSRAALLLPQELEFRVEQPGREPLVGPVERYLYEPNPAVTRAGGLAQLAEVVGGHALSPGIGYLGSAVLVETPLATAFAVLEVLPYDERTLRAGVRERGLGILEIKVRGLDVDPAALRKRLKPRGAGSATIVLTPTDSGAVAILVERLSELTRSLGEIRGTDR